MEGEIVNQNQGLVVAGRTDIAALGAVMTNSQLKAAIKRQQTTRDIILDWVKGQLVEGVDYGKIHLKRSCKADPCHNKSHWSKDTLFKPGQEKIFSLMQITTELELDKDLMSLVDNSVVFVCSGYRGTMKIAEGRGAALVGEGKNDYYDGRDLNSTIKMAEKRARIDLCLALGFSEFFTQDLDSKTGDQDVTTDAEAEPATQAQIQLINLYAQKLDKSIKGDLATLTKTRATALIQSLEEAAREKGLIQEDPKDDQPEVTLEFKQQVVADIAALDLTVTERTRLIKDSTRGLLRVTDTKGNLIDSVTEYQWRDLATAVEVAKKVNESAS